MKKIYDLGDLDSPVVDWKLDEEFEEKLEKQFNDDADKYADEQIQMIQEFPRKPMYDEDEGLDYTPERNPYLKDYEIEEAEGIFWALMAGLMINTGDEGSGKDTWAFYLAYKMRRYFAKTVCIDIPPRKLFDYYKNFIWKERPFVPFSLAILQEELSVIKKQAKKELKIDLTWQEAFDRWMAKRGAPVLTNSIILLSEFWKWAKKIRPTTNSVEVITALKKEYRHYKMLIVGNSPKFRDLEYNQVQRGCTHHVACSFHNTAQRPYTVKARLSYIRCVTTDGVFNVAGKATNIWIAGLEPREWLINEEGEQDYVFNLFNSVNKGTMFT